jgi:hypothetical protein
MEKEVRDGHEGWRGAACTCTALTVHSGVTLWLG